jgi:hypothetical protein
LRGHAVLSAQDWTDDFLTLLAHYEPDLVLMSEEPPFPNISVATVLPFFPDCLFRYLPSLVSLSNGEMPEALDALITEAEGMHRALHPVSRLFADEKRYILHDVAYQRYAAAETRFSPAAAATSRIAST